MKKKMTYKTPLAQVSEVFLEGVMADPSYNPVMPSGEVQYTPYEEEGVQYGDIILL
jgi:hypothetical protein